MEFFYKDKKRVFECKVMVEGADINNTSARLVLKFNESNMNLLYYGTINEDGICSIEIPALREMKSTKGEALLEVISESTFFEPWSSEFELKEAKTVKVEVFSSEKPVIKESGPRVMVEAVKQQEIKPDYKSAPQPATEEVREKEKPATIVTPDVKAKKEEPKENPSMAKMEDPASDEMKKKLLKLFKDGTKDIVNERKESTFLLTSNAAKQICEKMNIKKEDRKAFEVFLDKIKPDNLKKINMIIK